MCSPRQSPRWAAARPKSCGPQPQRRDGSREDAKAQRCCSMPPTPAPFQRCDKRTLEWESGVAASAAPLRLCVSARTRFLLSEQLRRPVSGAELSSKCRSAVETRKPTRQPVSTSLDTNGFRFHAAALQRPLTATATPISCGSHSAPETPSSHPGSRPRPRRSPGWRSGRRWCGSARAGWRRARPRGRR